MLNSDCCIFARMPEWTSETGQLSGYPGDKGLVAEMLPRDCCLFARMLTGYQCEDRLLELDNFPDSLVAELLLTDCCIFCKKVA
jgi:hypothetical protein